MSRPAPALLLGAHVPVAGGLACGPEVGRAIGANAIQVFTRNQRQWAARPLAEGEGAAFRAAVAANGIAAVLAHASYLVNLASPRPGFLQRSRDTLVDEVERCHALGIGALVVHPGAHLGSGVEAGVRTVAASLDEVCARTARRRVLVLLEVTAGQGTCLGGAFAEIGGVIARARHPERLGVCLDTCHLHAAGHDIVTPRGWARTMEEVDREVGLERVRAVHLNDARDDRGSHRDRHARAGEGTLGLATFRRVLRDPRLRGVPMVVENPGPVESWASEVARLRALAGAGRR